MTARAIEADFPRANTNLPTIAAAERLSDLVRGSADAAQDLAADAGRVLLG